MARKRRISVTSYNELVLGSQRSSSAPYVITEIEKPSSTIFAHNPFNNEFAERVAFVSTSESLSSATCDRREFIGRNGSLDKPAALRRIGLANRDGADSIHAPHCRYRSNWHRTKHAKSSSLLVKQNREKPPARSLLHFDNQVL
jgi:cellobiose phosphorylase